MGEKYRSRRERRPTNKQIRIEPRDIELLDFIQRHSWVSSHELFHLGLFGNKTTMRIRLAKLFDVAGLLQVPPVYSEHRTFLSDYLIYALATETKNRRVIIAPQTQGVLGERLHEFATPITGWDTHTHAHTRLTTWLDLACRKNGFTFIHRDDVWRREDCESKQPKLAINKEKSYTPDDLFEIDYAGKARSFIWETDLSTESLATVYAKLEMLNAIMLSGAWKKWGLWNPYVLIATTRMGRAKTILKYIENNCARPQIYLVKAFPEFLQSFCKVEDLYKVMEEPWLCTKGEYFINRP